MASPITRAKLAQNFLSAYQRPACRNCQSSKEMQQVQGMAPDASRLECRKGRFLVSPMAICQLHAYKQTGT